MGYRVELAERAARDLRRLYVTVNAEASAPARVWFNGLENIVLSLEQHTARGAFVPEDTKLRHLLYGRAGYRYRIIYTIYDQKCVVTVLHIRHGSHGGFVATSYGEEA